MTLDSRRLLQDSTPAEKTLGCKISILALCVSLACWATLSCNGVRASLNGDKTAPVFLSPLSQRQVGSSSPQLTTTATSLFEMRGFTSWFDGATHTVDAVVNNVQHTDWKQLGQKALQDASQTMNNTVQTADSVADKVQHTHWKQLGETALQDASQTMNNTVQTADAAVEKVQHANLAQAGEGAEVLLQNATAKATVVADELKRTNWSSIGDKVVASVSSFLR